MFESKKEKKDQTPPEEKGCRYTPIIKVLDLCLLFKSKPKET